MSAVVKNVVQQWGSHSRQSAPQLDLCEICGQKPKFVERGFKHDFCSRSCAAKGSQGPGPTACLLHGCRSTGKPAFAGFCTEAHAREAVRLRQVKGCQICEILPARNGDQCITCERLGPPRLRDVRKGSNTFHKVRAQFTSEWDSLGKPPVLEKVYEVVLPREIRKRHDQYRSAQRSPQEIRTFHGTQCICDMGVKDAPSLCNFKSCGICNIVKSSFHKFAFELAYNNGRFGDGIYSYRNPALADQHATSCISSPYRVMIACDTILESTIQFPENESVFVPCSEAITPAYVLMYTL